MIWDVIDGMTVIHPEIKRQLVRVIVFQDIFRLNVWVLSGIIVLYDWSTVTPNIVVSPQRLLVMGILEL
jgi:cellulose synthase/poly-beta-1,6-N-acetylglucosamine synthase-like glycosyltransferase